MDEVAKTENVLDEAFATIKSFLDSLNQLVKDMNKLRQLCDVIKVNLKNKVGD